jgi:hypothetical protein
VRCAVEHHVLVDLVADHEHVGRREQVFAAAHLRAVQTVALGLCGVLTMMARVLRRDRRGDLREVGRKVPGASGTRTTVPPASSMLGT